MKQINEYTIDELKVLAYDAISTIEMCQANLKVISEQIQKLSQLPKEEPKKK